MPGIYRCHIWAYSAGKSLRPISLFPLIPQSLRDAPVLGPCLLSGSDRNPADTVPPNTTFLLPPPNAEELETNERAPVVTYVLNLGTKVLRLDVVPASPDANTTTILGLRTLGSIDYYPFLYNPATDEGIAGWWGDLADGSYAPAGNYTLVLRALRLFGDVNNPDDYDSFETPEFAIQYGTRPNTTSTATVSSSSIGPTATVLKKA
jgi:hypothetical protein